MKRTKRSPVRTETMDEDDTLRLAHLLKAITHRSTMWHAGSLVERAFAFNGRLVKVKDAKVVTE